MTVAQVWTGTAGTTQHRLAIDSPVGLLVLEADDAGLCSVRRLRDALPLPDMAKVPDSLLRTRDELMAYFAGGLRRFSVPLCPQGTRFQRAVWAFVADIPYGTTITYRDLADLLGSAPRAVARACASNPLPFLIPCHRVVVRTGRGGSSAGAGVATKDWLLGLEGAPA
jgi:methylated-DNA-[protein]-cysteine S-methyltransferase